MQWEVLIFEKFYVANLSYIYHSIKNTDFYVYAQQNVLLSSLTADFVLR